MKQFIWVIVLAGMLTTGMAGMVKADTATLNMTGTLTRVFDHYGRFDGTDVKTGAQWQVTIQYDTGANPRIFNPDNGSYGTNATYDILSYTTRIGEYVFESDNPTANLSDNYHHWTRDLLHFDDYPDDYSYGNGIKQSLYFQDNSGIMLSEDDLSLERLTAFDFSSANFSMRYSTLEYLSESYRYAVDISGSLSTVSLTQSQSTVPVPGAIWLLGSGLAGLAGLRRKMS
jgi:hypothetical protein